MLNDNVEIKRIAAQKTILEAQKKFFKLKDQNKPINPIAFEKDVKDLYAKNLRIMSKGKEIMSPGDFEKYVKDLYKKILKKRK